jgi:hypothetical protein
MGLSVNFDLLPDDALVRSGILRMLLFKRVAVSGSERRISREE